jgi:ferredoxin-NADP reductase
LIENIVDFNQQFYVCGPESFVSDINKNLLELGAEPEFLVFEQ